MRRLLRRSLPPPQANDVAATAESTTVVENELYRITFTNRGAQVNSWILKKYKDDNGKPLDLVNQAGGDEVRLSALALHLRREPAQQAGEGALCAVGNRQPERSGNSEL